MATGVSVSDEEMKQLELLPGDSTPTVDMGAFEESKEEQHGAAGAAGGAMGEGVRRRGSSTAEAFPGKEQASTSSDVYQTLKRMIEDDDGDALAGELRKRCAEAVKGLAIVNKLCAAVLKQAKDEAKLLASGRRGASLTQKPRRADVQSAPVESGEAHAPGRRLLTAAEAWYLEQAVCHTPDESPGLLRLAVRGRRKNALEALLNGYVVSVEWPCEGGQVVRFVVTPCCPHAKRPRKKRPEGRRTKPDVSGPDLLTEAIIRWGDPDVVNLLIRYVQGVRAVAPFTDSEMALYNQIPLGARDENGRNVLHNVAFEPIEHAEAAEVLIRALSREDIQAGDDTDNQALHYAAYMGHSHITEALLSQSADVSSTNRRQETALHLAFLAGHKGVAQILLDHGARLDARDEKGRTPLHKAFIEAATAGQPVRRLKLCMGHLIAITEALCDVCEGARNEHRSEESKEEWHSRRATMFQELCAIFVLLREARHFEESKGVVSAATTKGRPSFASSVAASSRLVALPSTVVASEHVAGDDELAAAENTSDAHVVEAALACRKMLVNLLNIVLSAIVDRSEADASAELKFPSYVWDLYDTSVHGGRASSGWFRERDVYEAFKTYTTKKAEYLHSKTRFVRSLLRLLSSPVSSHEPTGGEADTRRDALAGLRGHRATPVPEPVTVYHTDSDSSDDEGRMDIAEDEKPGEDGLPSVARRSLRLFRVIIKRMSVHEHSYHLIIDMALKDASLDDLEDSDLQDRPVFTEEERLRWYDEHEAALDAIATNPRSDGPAHPAFQDKRTQAAIQTTWDQKLRFKMICRLVSWVVFVSILMVIAVAQTGRDSWYPRAFHVNLNTIFIDTPWGDTFPDAFGDIASRDDWWEWMEKVVTPAVYAPPSWHRNGGANQDPTPANEVTGTLSDFSYFVGRPRIRQLRAESTPCVLSDEFTSLEKAPCYTLFEFAELQTDPMKVGSLEIPFREHDVPWFRGVVDVYPGAGHSIIMPSNQTNWMATMEELKENQFIDMNTRVVFVELTVYNPSHNLFGQARMAVEFDAGGGAVPISNVDTLKLVQYVTGQDFGRMAMELIAIAYMVYYMVMEVIEMTQRWPAPPDQPHLGQPCCGRMRTESEQTSRKARKEARAAKKMPLGTKSKKLGATSRTAVSPAPVDVEGANLSPNVAFEASQYEVPTFKVWYPSLTQWESPDPADRLPPLFRPFVPMPTFTCCSRGRDRAPRGPAEAVAQARRAVGSTDYLEGLARVVQDDNPEERPWQCMCFTARRLSIYLRPVTRVVDGKEAPVQFIIPVYFFEVFNWVDMLLIACYAAVLSLHFVSVTLAARLPWDAEDEFVNTFSLGEVAQWKAYTLGIAFALGCFKTLDFMRVNSSLSTFILVIRGMLARLGSFFVLFLFCLVAFAGFEYAAFGLQSADSATVSLSLMRHFSASLGEADFERTFWLNQWLSPTAVFLFAVFVVILLFNLLIAVSKCTALRASRRALSTS